MGLPSAVNGQRKARIIDVGAERRRGKFSVHVYQALSRREAMLTNIPAEHRDAYQQSSEAG